MKNLMVMPKKYFFDKNGLPLAFGKVYTYQAGTLINKATYNSEAGDVANANPIILNSEGYADIFLDGSYDFVVDDADDANIWTAGPISSNVNEEWTNCTEATYISPTSFKLPGNLVDVFDVGRRVRIDNDVPEFAYASILTSVFAASETTITVDAAVVAVGILEACAAIVGGEATETTRVRAQNGTIVFEGGTDGTDATATADLTGDVTGNVIGNVSGNAGTADVAAKVGTLIPKEIEIGDWDMEAAAAKLIAHGLTLDKIRRVTFEIRDDADSIHFDDGVSSALGVVQLWVGSTGSTNITLNRLVGGLFDDANYSATSFNRGWVVIWYVD